MSKRLRGSATAQPVSACPALDLLTVGVEFYTGGCSWKASGVEADISPSHSLYLVQVRWARFLVTPVSLHQTNWCNGRTVEPESDW